ncbi:MAG: hypothetical protein K6G50_02630 [bacterium]|nr:hypothetical protein [bacterium]
MKDRKDDIIIGLMVVIIILQVYSLFFGRANIVVDATKADIKASPTASMTMVPNEKTSDKAPKMNEQGLPNDNGDPTYGANVPGEPGAAAQPGE